MSLLEAVATSRVPSITAGVRKALPYLTAMSLQGSPLSGPRLKALSLGAAEEKLPQLSANEIIRRIRASGFSIQRASALKVIKALKQQIDAHAYIQGLAGSIKPLRSLVPLAGNRQTFPYHIRVLLTGRDNFTGELRNQYVTVTSTSLLSKNKAIEAAYEVAMGGEAYNLTDMIGMDVVTYTKQNPAIV